MMHHLPRFDSTHHSKRIAHKIHGNKIQQQLSVLHPDVPVPGKNSMYIPNTATCNSIIKFTYQYILAPYFDADDEHRLYVTVYHFKPLPK